MDLIQKIKEQGNQASVLLPETMQNMGGSYYTYKKIRELAESLGWGSIVNAILSSDVFNNGIVDITAYKTVDSLMEALGSFVKAVKDTLGYNAIYNLPCNEYGDGDSEYDKFFYIPVTFIGIHNLMSPSNAQSRIDNSPGKIVIHRDDNRTGVYIGFNFFFEAGVDLCEYSLSTDTRNKIKNVKTFQFTTQNL